MLIESSVGDCFAEVARRRDRAVALLWEEDGALQRMDFASLLARTERAAAHLLQHVSPGDRVALWAANSVEWIVAEYGAATAGAVLVPLNPALTASEATHILRDSDARVVLTGPPWRGRDLHAVALEVATGRTVLSLADLGTAGPLVDRPTIAPTAPLRIQYTSGTTGPPKGALINHLIGANVGPLSHTALGLTEDDVVCSPLPYHHVGGSLCTSSATLLRGAAFVSMSAFVPTDALALLDRAGVTFFGGVPTMMVSMLEACAGSPPPLPLLRLMMLGGSDVSPELIEQVERAFGAEILNGYGQSEAPSALQTHRGDPAWIKARTIGRVNSHRECRITAPGTGEPVPPGETGELRLRGRMVIDRYWQAASPDAPALVDGDGWLHTGDLASMDADGVVTLRGRLKDLIIRGGENIYPAEVEAVIGAHPGVADVAVVAAADLKWGQVPVAFVRPLGDPPGPEELETFARERLASFKVPRTWHAVEQFPMTPSGKIQKFRLVQELAAASPPTDPTSAA